MSLKSYSGHGIEVLGSWEVDVQYEGTRMVLPLLVIEGDGPTLFGRNWLAELRLNWKAIQSIQEEDEVQSLLAKYSKVFGEYLGKLRGVTAKLYVDPEARPVFCKARPVSYALQEQELDRLEKEDVGSVFRMGFTYCACGKAKWRCTHFWRL